MVKVFVRRGDWNNQVISGKTFHLFRGLSIGAKGPFITVNGTGVDGYPQRNFRIGIKDPGDMMLDDPAADIFAPRAKRQFSASPDPKILRFIGSGNVLNKVEAGHVIHTNETDEEISERITERFTILQGLATDAARGNLKGLVVWGASGMGKSYEVLDALNRDSLMDKLSYNADAPGQNQRRIGRGGKFKPRYNIVKGFTTAAALFVTLYESRESREVLVLDDCDTIYGNEDAMNLLKAALDTTGPRTITWGTTSRNPTDVPNQFDFKGSVIFITNINFERIVEKGTARMTPHLVAIMDRCLCLDLTIDTLREKLVRIDHVSRDLRMLEQQYNLNTNQIDEILNWTHKNAKRFRELSLRKVGQLASLRTGQKNWERVAEVTLLKR